MVSKDKFDQYVNIQKSGVTNMWAVDTVCELSIDLTVEECLDIMKNYSKYQEQFK